MIIGILFAVAAAVFWGGSEFLGGLQSKTSRVLTVLWISSVGALAVGFILVALYAKELPPLSEIWGAIPAGILSVASLVFIYRAVAIGPAIAVLPTAACAAILPVVWGFLTGSPFDLLGGITCAVALIASLFAAGVTEFTKLTEHERSRLKISLPYALIASVMVGAYFILSKEASQADPYWTVTIARMSDLVVVTITIGLVRIFRAPLQGQLNKRVLLVAGSAGITDILAELGYAISTTQIDIGVASVISSLYPTVTILLALIFWKEKPSITQTVGLVVTLAAVAFLSLNYTG